MRKKAKPRLALFLHHPICSAHCVAGVSEALYEKYDVRCFTVDQIRSNTFKNTKIIAFPGGEGDSDKFNTIVRPYMEPIHEFLDKRGKYLGICMGAYWAGSKYFDILKNLDAVQYIHRPKAEIRRSHPTTIDIEWSNITRRMYFYDGCAIIGNGRHEKIATYKNGDAMAIIQKNIGIIGCHPESMKSWYDKPYMKSYWHKYLHHKLLTSFVDDLLER